MLTNRNLQHDGSHFWKNNDLARASLFFLIGVITLVAIACGSGSYSEEVLAVANITPSELIFTMEDLAEIDLKKSKTYDV